MIVHSYADNPTIFSITVLGLSYVMYVSTYLVVVAPNNSISLKYLLKAKILFCLAPMCPERHLEGAAMLGHEGLNSKKSDAGAILGDMMRKFMEDMKIPDGLSALNYTKDDVPALVAGAIPQVSKYYYLLKLMMSLFLF